MHSSKFHARRRAAGWAALFTALSLAGCTTPKPTGGTGGSVVPANPNTSQALIADFEHPDPPVAWIPLEPATIPSTQPEPSSQFQPATTEAAATQPAEILHRSSLRPYDGLWSLSASVTTPGTIRYTPPKPLDLGHFNLLVAQISHTAPPTRNGEFSASLALTDADGKTIASDAY